MNGVSGGFGNFHAAISYKTQRTHRAETMLLATVAYKRHHAALALGERQQLVLLGVAHHGNGITVGLQVWSAIKRINMRGHMKVLAIKHSLGRQCLLANFANQRARVWRKNAGKDFTARPQVGHELF